MRWILVTGSNRGIGLEIVRQFLQQSDTFIFASCRNPKRADQLQNLVVSYPDRVQMIELDVVDESSIEQAVRQVQKRTNEIDILINNAAINPERSDQTFEALSTQTLLHVFQVNTIGAFNVTRACFSLLKNAGSAKVIMVSSQLGSLTNRRSGGLYAYCSSKAALNMVTRGLAAELSSYGITTITLHPGWVRTDMGGSGASLEVEDSVEGVISVIENITPKDNGTFHNWNGESLPW